MSDPLNKLQNIKQVETPPFLLTRIQARLQSSIVPTPWKWAFGVVAVLILVCNLAVVFYQQRFIQHSAGDMGTVVQTLHLSASNELYHE